MPEAPPTPQVQFSNVIPDQQEELVAVKPIVNEKLLRASLEPKTRVFLISSMGGFWGFSMGAFLGAKHSGLQYLAENAHRLPTTVQGWYFYHKTKNYRMMLGGVKRGMRFAAKTGGMCFMYGAIEAGLDEARGEADVFNSVAAGMTTGTLFSVLSKFV
jgi:hypothetical protein